MRGSERILQVVVGVAVLTGINPKGGWAGAAGTLAVVAASLSYAVGTLYTQGILEGIRNDVALLQRMGCIPSDVPDLVGRVVDESFVNYAVGVLGPYQP